MVRHLSEFEFEDFPRFCGEWLRGIGPKADVVVSSRIRLARNISGFPFPAKMNEQERQEIVEIISEAIRGAAIKIDLEESSPIDRALLVERHLISKELAASEGPRCVIFGRHEMISIMVNEEDHLRLQCMKAGFDLDHSWRALSRIDRYLESQIPYAFHKHFGFLTSCPTNVGTAIRVSVMLHLPALTLKRHIKRVHKAVEHMNLTLRGLYGEGTQAFGDFYQVSNQATLGRSEEELVQALKHLVPKILEYEYGMREALLKEGRAFLEERIQSALTTLRSTQKINIEKTMEHLSMVRLGLHLDMISEPHFSMPRLNELFLTCQPAHLQKREGRSLTAEERDILRAGLVRKAFTVLPLN